MSRNLIGWITVRYIMFLNLVIHQAFIASKNQFLIYQGIDWSVVCLFELFTYEAQEVNYIIFSNPQLYF